MLVPFFSFSQKTTSDTAITKSAGSFSGWNDLSFNTASLTTRQFKDSLTHEFGITGNGVISSNSVNLSFSIAALRNEFIDDDQKNSVSEDLEPVNVFEFNTDGEIYYRFIAPDFLFHSPALLSFSLKSGAIQQTKFTDDLFSVVFFGNAGFAGATADFSDTRSELYDYRQLRFGIQKKFFTASSAWETGIGISFLSVKNGTDLELTHATLFTEQNGEYIDAVYDFKYMESDSSNTGSLQVDGVGAAADIMICYTPKGGRSNFVFYVNDLGIISWNKHATLYSADSSLHFEGITVTDFLLDTDSTFFQFNKDSLLKKTGTAVESGSYSTVFPMRFSFVYFHSFSNKWMGRAGITYRPYPDLLPMFFIQPQYLFTRWLTAGILLSYGGTARLGAGVLAGAVISKRIHLRVGSENVLGLIMPEQTSSTSLFLQAAVTF
ncbi:MAG: DUF5723 family protein [Chitinophagales bacterium]